MEKCSRNTLIIIIIIITASALGAGDPGTVPLSSHNSDLTNLYSTCYHARCLALMLAVVVQKSVPVYCDWMK